MIAFFDVSQAFDKVWHADLLQNQKLLRIQFVRNHKIISIIKNLQSQIWRSITQLKNINSGVAQRSVLCSICYTLQIFSRLRYHNCNLCGRRSNLSGSQKPHKNIPVCTRKPFLHPKMANKIENHSQWSKNLYRYHSPSAERRAHQ